MDIIQDLYSRSLATNTDDVTSQLETSSMLNTFYINLFIFAALMLCFELMRHNRTLFFPRLCQRFIKSKRVPKLPPTHIFGWVVAIWDVSDDEFLRMVGLDAYVFIRYIKLCFKTGVFFTVIGLCVLLPLYIYGGGGSSYWNRYTLANIPNDTIAANKLWFPVIIAYIFSGYFCYLLYEEYRNFVDKRLIYLIEGDPDTPPQVNYTVMIEKVPAKLRSPPMLRDFFEKLFPGQVYDADIMFDLADLDQAAKLRFDTRNQLEKHVAVWQATGKRPVEYISREELDEVNARRSGASRRLSEGQDEVMDLEGGLRRSAKRGGETDDSAAVSGLVSPLHGGAVRMTQSNSGSSTGDLLAASAISASDNSNPNEQRDSVNDIYFTQPPVVSCVSSEPENLSGKVQQALSNPCCSVEMVCVDSVEYYCALLRNMNDEVAEMQKVYEDRKNKLDEAGNEMVHSKLRMHASALAGFVTERVDKLVQLAGSGADRRQSDGGDDGSRLSNNIPFSGVDGCEFGSPGSVGVSTTTADETRDSAAADVVGKSSRMDPDVGIIDRAGGAVVKGVTGVIDVVGHTAQLASKGAVKGLLEASRTLELLTFGAYYRTSSTAFVTFSSRIATCSAYQMLLSHEFFTMIVKLAPNARDIIWDNVSIPENQNALRHTIADYTIIVGAIFWSIVVGAIAAISNLDSLAEEYTWINEYKDTLMYQLLNQYLAVALLLILLSILPLIFDIIARSYEGMKLESEIQNSIMTRYFYYQVANVYVALGLGSIATSIHAVINSPSNILSILGASLPSVSTYFVSLVIVKSFTALPLELMRIGPLLAILGVKSCSDKKKCTRRELRSGAFADPPMLYGWCYPNIMMVLMIMVAYSCIAPLLMPFCCTFFGFAYLMYKYQLLYVYINDYQAGGFMWYAVFDRSMAALIMANVTLLGYYLIRLTYDIGAMYFLVPLPFFLVYFWRYCDARFRQPTQQLSLDAAKDLDEITSVRKQHGKPIPLDFFSRKMYSQPSLGRTKPVLPAPYRMKKGAVAAAAATAAGVEPLSASEAVDAVDVAQASSSIRDSNAAAAASSTAPEVVVGTTSIKLGLGRQSLGGGGMYAYDDLEDEEDIHDKAKQWEGDAPEAPQTSPVTRRKAAGSKSSLVASPEASMSPENATPKMPSYGSINDPNK